MEDPVVPLEKNLYGHPLAGLLWERQFEKVLLKHGWEKIPNWECLFVHREKGLFLSVYVDDIKLAGKKQNLDPMWKVLKRSSFGRTQEHTSIILISTTFVARRPVYVRLALWFLHHPAWVKGHTGGSRLTPTVHPCPVQLGRLWVAYVLYEPNVPQEHAQPAHGSGARVQDHDPETSQPAQTTALRPLAQVMVAVSRTAV